MLQHSVGHFIFEILSYKFSTKKTQKQDLSLKCSAWKGFTPRLEWKSPSQKQILSPIKFLSQIEY